MSNPSTKGRGKAIAFILAHRDYAGDDCIIWPFNRLPDPNGYGLFGYLGKSHYAHRFMCALVNGEPPTPEHKAAHSCGKGHEGCITPRHLSWKTQSGNEMDKRLHGTQSKSWWGQKGKLKPAQVLEIRSLQGNLTQRQIADRFGITESTVRSIHNGETWKTFDKRSDERKRIMALLASGPMRAKEIGARAAVCHNSGLLQKMTKQGQLTRIGRGLYGLSEGAPS